MTRDLESELRDRLHSAPLPSAPARLNERLAAVTSEQRPNAERPSPGGRTRLLLPLAAALAIAAITVSGWGGRPQPSTAPVHTSGVPGVGAVPFTIESKVGEWCSQVGGCEFHIELTGPGGPWQGKLDDANLGSPTDPTPRFPTTLGHGSYVLSAEIHVFGDAIPVGATGPPDLGTVGTCSAEFDVTTNSTAARATLGFWLDRCSAAVVVEDETTRRSGFTVMPSYNGDCGAFGCEYRVRLATSKGSWQTVLRSPKLSDEIATGSGIPEALPPGSYFFEATSHRMSDEPSPGSGHRQEEGVAATCSAQVTVRADERASFEVHVHFRDETCVIEVFTRLAIVDSRPSPTPSATSPIRSPATPPDGICEANPRDLRGLECDRAFAAVLATLEPGHPAIEQLHFFHQCWSSNPALIVDCAIEWMGIVDVTFVGVSEGARFGISGPEVPGREPTVTLLSPTGIFGPTYPPEPPMGREVAFQRVALSADRRTLTVDFYGGGCFSDFVSWVRRSGEDLLVGIVEVTRPEPLPSGFACVGIAIPMTYLLALPEPFPGDTVWNLNGDVLVVE